MKLILLLFSSFFFYSSTQSNWKEMGLKGKVKSLKTQQTYRYRKNGVDFTPWEKTYTKSYLFDKKGLYTEFTDKKSDGTSGYRIKYTNNLKEKKIEQAYFDKDDKPTIKKIINLDEKERIIELVEYTRDGKVDRTYFYTYDDKGNKNTVTGKKADGTITSKYTWTYNDKNQKTDQKLETPGYANSYMSWKYDARGNQTGESWYDGNKEITLRFERVYDDKGNKTEESKYKNGNEFISKVTWKYEYDKQGNWTRRAEYTNAGEDFHIEERTLVYY